MSTAPAPRRGTAARVGWRAVGGILTAALVVTTASGFAVDLVQREGDRSFPLAGVERLEVHNGVGDVSLVVAPAGTAPSATAHYQHSWGDVPVQATSDGGTSTLRSRCSLAGRCSADWVVRVPAGTRVVVETGVGDVRVEGDLEVTRLSSGTGDVTARGVRAATSRFETGVGEVSVTTTEAPRSLDAQSGTGNVSVSVPEVAGGYHVVGDSGVGERRIEVAQSASSARSITVQSGVGDVRVTPR